MRSAVPLVLLLAACVGGPPLPPPSGGAPPSEANRYLVPAGYGTLRQEDISIRLQLLGFQVQATPLDETIIRLLAPDSYRALRELAATRRRELDDLARRTGLREFSLWRLLFFGTQLGEAPFSPEELTITSGGRDFRPLAIVPLSPGFGRQRLAQRETQAALYVFDPQVDVNQPLVLQFQTTRSDEWTQVLERVERERALVRSRAGVRPPDGSRY